MESQKLTPETFQNGIMLLREAFPRESKKLSSAVLLPIWLKFFTDNLTDTQFADAVKQIVLSCEFLPPPTKFVELAIGSTETKALDEFMNIVEAAKRGNLAFANLSDRAKEALGRIGGFDRVRMADDVATNFLRKEFVTDYAKLNTSTVVLETTPELPASQMPTNTLNLNSGKQVQQPRRIQPAKEHTSASEGTPVPDDIAQKTWAALQKARSSKGI